MVAALAQLLLDLAHLLAQHVLALALVELLLGLLADLLGDAQHADALGEVLEHLVEAPLEVEGLEQVLLVLVLDVEQVGDHVGEQRRRVMPCTTTASSSGALGSSEIASTAWLFSWRKRASTSGSTLPRLDHLHARHQERPARQELEHAEAALALHHEVMRALGAGDVAHHLAGGADPVEVLRLDVVRLRVALEQEADLLLAAHRFLGGGDRRWAADGDGRDHAREQHRVPHRDDDQRVFRQRFHRLGSSGGSGRAATTGLSLMDSPSGGR